MRFLIHLLIVGMVVFAPGCSTGSEDTVEVENNYPDTEETIIISGLLRRVGADPFSQLVLSDENENEWYISKEDESVVAGYEQRIITVRAVYSTRQMILADGRVLGERKELSNIQLISK